MPKTRSRTLKREKPVQTIITIDWIGRTSSKPFFSTPVSPEMRNRIDAYCRMLEAKNQPMHIQVQKQANMLLLTLCTIAASTSPHTEPKTDAP